jgi:hypothetical protein
MNRRSFLKGVLGVAGATAGGVLLPDEATARRFWRLDRTMLGRPAKRVWRLSPPPPDPVFIGGHITTPLTFDHDIRFCSTARGPCWQRPQDVPLFPNETYLGPDPNDPDRFLVAYDADWLESGGVFSRRTIAAVYPAAGKVEAEPTHAELGALLGVPMQEDEAAWWAKGPEGCPR